MKKLITIDTICMNQNFNIYVLDNLRTFYTDKKLKDSFCLKRHDLGEGHFAVDIKKKGFDESFLFIEFADGSFELDGTPLVTGYFTIHLNHCYHQLFDSEYIDPSLIVEKLESLIRRALHFPTFKLDRLRVSYVDIAFDIMLSQNSNDYLEFLKHKPYSRYILHPNKGNGTLSIHSFKTVDEINNPKIKTENKGTFYNKLRKMGIGENILRLELRLAGNAKNSIPLSEYTSDGFFHLERTGITSFSDIFKADLASVINKRLVEKFILKDKKKLLSKFESPKYSNTSDRWRSRFESVDEYYEQLIPLYKEREVINNRIKSERNLWVSTQLTEDHSPKLLTDIWNDVENNLLKKFRAQLKMAAKHLDMSVEETILYLKDKFLNCSFKDFISLLSITLAKKENHRVDSPHESTEGVIMKYFKKKYNADKKDYKEGLLKDVKKEIADLNRDFKLYQEYNFLHALLKASRSGHKGLDLYEELSEVIENLNSTDTHKQFNLYKFYHYTYGLQKGSMKITAAK
jgi:hypothetical protein